MLTPNKSYGLSPKPNFTFDTNTYTSSTALLNAMKTGQVEIGNIDPGTQLPQIPALQHDGFSVYGGPGWGWFGGFFNWGNTTRPTPAPDRRRHWAIVLGAGSARTSHP